MLTNIKIAQFLSLVLEKTKTGEIYWVNTNIFWRPLGGIWDYDSRPAAGYNAYQGEFEGRTILLDEIHNIFCVDGWQIPHTHSIKVTDVLGQLRVVVAEGIKKRKEEHVRKGYEQVSVLIENQFGDQLQWQKQS